jgi:hypothetical protein
VHALRLSLTTRARLEHQAEYRHPMLWPSLPKPPAIEILQLIFETVYINMKQLRDKLFYQWHIQSTICSTIQKNYSLLSPQPIVQNHQTS